LCRYGSGVVGAEHLVALLTQTVEEQSGTMVGRCTLNSIDLPPLRLIG
jgi:hypothetical protein